MPALVEPRDNPRYIKVGDWDWDWTQNVGKCSKVVAKHSRDDADLRSRAFGAPAASYCSM